VQPGGVKTLSGGIDMAFDHVGSKDMAGIGVWIAEEIGKRDSREGVVIGEVILEELHGEWIVKASRGVD